MKITDQRYQEVADTLNDYYGSNFTMWDVKKYITVPNELQEIFDNTYRDTCIRESLLDSICLRKYGMSWPMNGDSVQYSKLFYEIVNDMN